MSKPKHLDLPADLTVEDPDFVPILNDRLRRLAPETAASVPTLLVASHGMRLARFKASSYPVGTLFIESDRRVVYVAEAVGTTKQWKYLHGTMRAGQGSLPTDLKANDQNFRVHVTDYDHILRWTGTAWEWGPGNEVSGKVEMFAVAPGTGWKLLDGTGDDGVNPVSGGNPIRYLKSDGTLGSLTAFAAMIGVYPRGGAAGSFTGAIVAATPPLISGSTATESGHTHSVDPPLTASATESGHTHSIDHDHAPITSSAPAGTVAVQSGTGTTVGDAAHSHQVDPPNFVGTSGGGSAHAHDVDIAAFTSGGGSAHGHAAGSLVNDTSGHPDHMRFPMYFRK